MISCTRRLEFDAGHRVLNHEGKCRHLHGHRYAVEVTAVPHDGLDHVGRVVDFSVLKTKLGGWIDQCWDHGFIVDYNDHEAREAMNRMSEQKVYRLPDGVPATAEGLAKYLLEVVCPKLLWEHGVTVVKVVVHETPNCSATATV